EGRSNSAALWIEDKYDGIRCQLHKVGQRAALYSRDLKEITLTFPEVADAALEFPDDLILDGEIIAMRGETVLPFSDLQKRLGRRGLGWLKLKKALATLDCVVVGAEYGHGKRNKVLSDYTFAVRDEASGELKTIGKAYSGLTDAEIAQLTEHFLSKVIRKHGR